MGYSQDYDPRYLNENWGKLGKVLDLLSCIITIKPMIWNVWIPFIFILLQPAFLR